MILKLVRLYEQAVAIHGIFSPCKYKNTELVDGGIRENVPWKIIKQMGAEKVISIVFESEKKKNCCPNVVSVITNSIGILNHELSNYELIGADYLLKIKTPDVSLLDVEEIDNLYHLGYVQAKQKIQEIKKILG